MATEPHLPWGAEALWESLLPLLPGLSVEVVSRLESTNTRLLERARAPGGAREAPAQRSGEPEAPSPAGRAPQARRSGDVSPCLLVAEEQTRGRGRLGRDWVSSAGASLTFSLSLPLAPVRWEGLSLAVGLALAEALDPGPGEPRLALKWPNDLWLADGPGHGRKLGGILIETVTVGDRRLCVVGVGLNVRPQPAGRAEGLPHGYACLRELDDGITAPQALARVARPLAQALRAFEAQGFAPLVAAYRRRDLLLDQAVATSGPKALQGVARGVDEQGALCVATPDGGTEVHRVVSGEVSVRWAGR